MKLKQFLQKLQHAVAVIGLASSSLVVPLTVSADETTPVAAPENKVTYVYEEKCRVGRDVKDDFTDVMIGHKKWDGEKGKEAYSDPSDKKWEINDYQTIHTSFDGTLKNEDGSLKAGDFFTVQLPKETRFEDLLQQNLARAKDIYAKDDSGELVATAHYNPTTNTITYVFTAYVESHKDIQIHTEYVETLNQDKLRGNQNYTFKGNYAGHESSYSYYLDNWSLQDVTRFNNVDSENPAEVVNKLTEVNPLNTTFKTIMNAKVSGTGSELKFTYDQDSRVTRSADTQLTIYAVPEDELLDGSFRSYSDTWTDVTASFTREEKGKNLEYTTKSNTHTQYVVVAQGNYNPDLGIWVQLITTYTDPTSGKTKPSGIVAYMTKEPTQEWAKAVKNGDLTESKACTPYKEIQIEKVDSKDASKKLAGAEFEVYNAQNELVANVTTNDEGKAAVENLSPGVYTVEEVKAPEGYKPPKEGAHTQKIDLTREDARAAIYQVVNEKANTGSISFQKISDVPCPPGQNSSVVIQLPTNSGGVVDRADSTIPVIVSGADAGRSGCHIVSSTVLQSPWNTGGVVDRESGIVERANDSGSSTTEAEKKDVAPSADSSAIYALAGVVFELRQNNEVVDTAISDEIGRVRFDNVPVGTYQIVEVSTVEGYILDPTERTVAITKDGEDVVLDPIVNIKEKPTSQPISVSLSVDKELKGAELKANQFTFELKKDGQVVATAQNVATGRATFEAQTFSEEGEYEYTISEKNDGQPNVTYDLSEKKVLVAVTKDEKGQLVAKASYDGSAKVPTFTNSYEAPKVTPASVSLSVDKELKGAELKANQFTFELKKDGQVVATAQNVATGRATFEAQTFSEEGEYEYTISEKNDGQPNVTYDLSEKKVLVAVTKDEKGQLVAKVSYDGSAKVPTFTNSYEEPKVTPASVELQAKKVLDGKELAEHQFKFELRQGTDVLESVSNSKDGLIKFPMLTFEKEGTYTYTIAEENDNQANVTYDATEKQVSITVTKNSANQLVAEVVYDGASEIPIFTNVYTAPPAPVVPVVLQVDKKLAGKDLESGQFSFVLTGDGIADKVVATNNKAGRVTFPEMTFDKEGVYTYTIAEENDGQANVTYDATKKQVIVTVIKTGESLVAEVTYDGLHEVPTFTNTYDEPKLPSSNVVLKKVDAKDHTKVLAGVVFALHRDGVKDVEAITGIDGIARFENVEPGTYVLSEKVTISGYRLSSETRVVTVTGDGKEIDLGEFENEPVPPSTSTHQRFQVRLLRQVQAPHQRFQVRLLRQVQAPHQRFQVRLLRQVQAPHQRFQVCLLRQVQVPHQQCQVQPLHQVRRQFLQVQNQYQEHHQAYRLNLQVHPPQQHRERRLFFHEQVRRLQLG
ncbi:Spy0128 family protein [Streptococcus marmotae]|uniref:Spy0128 family protein n=1 Tax=Streptococcus marmotae TaxID=1825069 RepID=UPI00082EF921|nr:FctA domain-containing protein [Streptococcus marmotae]